MVEQEIIKIIKLLENDNPALRQLALEQLIPYKNEQTAIDAIIQALKDSDEDVRTYAAEILGQIDSSQSQISLSQALDDSSWSVRKAVITSFGMLKNPETLSFIIHSLKDEINRLDFTVNEQKLLIENLRSQMKNEAQ